MLGGMNARVSLPLLAAFVFAGSFALRDAGAETKKRKAPSESAEEATPRPKKKDAAEATPKPKKSSEGETAPEASTTPRPSPTSKKSAAKATPAAGAGRSTPAPATPKRKRASEEEEKLPSDPPAAKSTPKPEPASSTPAPADASADPAKQRHAGPGTVATSEILGFEDQPPRVRRLIEGALALTQQNLTYTYGSADPANGGMDCSGAIYYLLRQQGFSDVARDASGQYSWLRKQGTFFAVVSKNAGGFEFSDLLPGDLMFWSGTYSVDRDPPVTHSMIYLGVQRKRGQHIMWGSSDGRSFDGKARWGVSVFDFKMPKANRGAGEGTGADFLGYARLPGLRE